jgi:hypothetical protein
MRETHMQTGPTMTFTFQELADAKGLETFRPIIPLRPMAAPLGHSERCLVDTGSPNTYLDWQLAPLAGVDLSRAEKLPDPKDWSVGGVAVEELWGATVALMIPDARYMIRLGDVPVVFVKPWLHPDFTAVLGTDGMRRIELIVSAGVGDGQLTVVQR